MVRLLRRPKLGALLGGRRWPPRCWAARPLAAQISGSSQGPSPAAAQPAAPAQPGGRARHVRLTSAVTAGHAGHASHPGRARRRICSVPGIGDIGGLLGFCNAGSSGVNRRPQQHLPAVACPTRSRPARASTR